MRYRNPTTVLDMLDAIARLASAIGTERNGSS